MHRARRLDDALALFRFFFEQSRIAPNVVSYNLLILSHCDASRIDDALAAYHRLLDSAPFTPSAVTFRHLTKGLVDAGRLGDALLLLREMLTRNLAADSLVYNNVISGFLAEDNLDKALELFDELLERCVVYDGTVVASFMAWYFRKGQSKEAMDAYRALMEKKFEMGPLTCNALLEVLLRHGKERDANWLFESMLSRHLPPKFHAMNTDTYNIMVDNCFRKGDIDGAVEVFHRSGTKPCAMDVGCFNNIIGKLLEHGALDNARKLFDEMPERSVNPDAATFGLFVEFHFKKGEVDYAIQWVQNLVNLEGEKAPKVTIDWYNMMYEGLKKAKRLDFALEMYRKMQQQGVRPDLTTFETLVTASCDGLLDQVRFLVEEMARIRIVCSPELRERVLDAFGKEGRNEEVERFFETPRSAVLPTSNYTRIQPQAFHQNPSLGSYHPNYTSNQSSRVLEPPVQPSHLPAGPHVATAFSGQSHFPGRQGTSFASAPPLQHVTAPGSSQFGAPHQHASNASGNAMNFTGQFPSFSLSQISNAREQSSTLDLPESQFLRQVSQVAPASNHMEASYMNQSQVQQETNYRENSFQHLRPPPTSSYGAGYGESANVRNSQQQNFVTCPQVPRETDSHIPYRMTSETRSGKISQQMHAMADHHPCNGRAPESSLAGSSPPNFPFNSQIQMASHVPGSENHVPSTVTNQSALHGMNLGRSGAVYDNPQAVPPQVTYSQGWNSGSQPVHLTAPPASNLDPENSTGGSLPASQFPNFTHSLPYQRMTFGTPSSSVLASETESFPMAPSQETDYPEASAASSGTCGRF